MSSIGPLIVRALAALLLAAAVPALAATHYIRDGGAASTSGTGSCTGWATANACDQLPTTLVRGDTYCVADGSYNSRTISTAPSGASTITIRKAVNGDGICDQGSNWSSTYGDGQAVWSGRMTLATTYLVLDGATRNENDWSDSSAYGFRITGDFHSNGVNETLVGSNITIRYFDAGATSGTACSTTVSCPKGIYAAGFGKTQSNWLVERNKFHDNDVPILLNDMDGGTFQYNYIIDGWNKEAIRGQANTKNIVIRWNKIFNSCRGLPGDATAGGCTAQIAIWDSASPGSLDGTQVYGNLIATTLSTSHSDACILVGGNGGTLAGVSGNNVKVYNNTIYGVQNGICTIIVPSVGTTGNEIRNNLWGGLGGGVSSGASGANTMTNNAVQNGIYANVGTRDFHLTSDTSTTWFSLSSPFNTDMDGVTRTSSIGAFQYTTGEPPASDPVSQRIPWHWLGSIAALGLLGGIWRIFNGCSDGRGGSGGAPAFARRGGRLGGSTPGRVAAEAA